MAALIDVESSPVEDSVCMLFTDIEGSTRLVDEHGDIYEQLLLRHNELLKDSIHSYGGKEINVVGDSILALFPASTQGVQAAIDAQFAISKEDWAEGCNVRVRMGLHSGKVRRHADHIVGIEVHRAARISSVAHGGQIVISSVVRDEIKKGSLQPAVKIRDLGFHRLKDLRYPEALFDLIVPGLTSEFAPISSVSSNRTNLPSEPTILYGRDSEISRLRRIVADKQLRLITLTGTGGAGKTSLAISASRDVVGSFSRGVFLVQLREVNSADLISGEICKAIGIQEVPGVPAIDSICSAIGEAEVLLILDTFEHLVEGAPIVTTLLNRCPRLSFIITSRESLKLRSETEVIVMPLPVPIEDASPEEIKENASFQLFENVVRRERPEFVWTDSNIQSISRICRRLDGLPLALELAASHIGVLDPIEIEARLATKLQDLRHRSRDVDPRHRTLRLTIEWSDSLLTESQRRTFHGISVFAGGFDLRAAEHLFHQQFDVIDDLESLLEKSLLFRTTALGRPRFSMLDTIREFSNELLRSSGEYEFCRKRHARFFSDLVVAVAPKVMRSDQRDFVEGLFLEVGNIRVALDWLVQQPSAAEAVELLGALKWFWISRGQFSEALRWTDAALLQARRVGEPGPLAAILDIASLIRYMSGDPATALEYSVESYLTYLNLGDQGGIASSGAMAGIAKATAGDLEDGGRLIFESLELSRKLGDAYGTALALIAMGEGTRAQGDEAAAKRYYNDALRLLEGLGDTYWPGHLLQNLAHFQLHKGNWRAAAKLACQALAIGEQYDYPMVVNLAVAAISGVLVAKGHAVKSAYLIGAVRARLDRLGAQFEPTDAADFQRIASTVREGLGRKRFLSESKRGASSQWHDVLSVARSYGKA
jgi:predicted ATPase/class 3 adenylate cyclase